MIFVFHQNRGKTDLFCSGGKPNQRMCDLCFAEKPNKKADWNMNFKNMSPNAPYQLAVMDHATYMATATVSEWHVVPGWHLHNCVFDVMHNLFLGVGRDYIASSVRLLMEKGVFDEPGIERSSTEMFGRVTLGIHDMFKEHKFSDIKPARLSY